MKSVKFQLLVVLVIALCICCSDKGNCVSIRTLDKRQDPSSTISTTPSPESTSSESTPSSTSTSLGSTSSPASTPSPASTQTTVDPSLPETSDGTCGQAVGKRCATGVCCSQKGFCGVTPEHCQAGCQPLFGTCGVPDVVRNKGFQFNTCTENGTMAITFDDGPQNFTHKLLDNLKEKDVKATFFMNGHAFADFCIYDYADVVQRAFKEGHQIASHTWSHLHLPQVSEEEILYQIETLEVAFKKIIGAVPTYFRPPFGEQNELVQKILRQKGYKMIIWDIDTNDFKGDLQVAIDLYNTEMNKFPQPNPHIVLNHDRIESTCTTLAPLEVSDALQRGYKVTTVGDCTGKPDKDDWYRDIGEPEQRDDTWKCTIEDMHLPPETSAAPATAADTPAAPATTPAATTPYATTPDATTPDATTPDASEETTPIAS